VHNTNLYSACIRVSSYSRISDIIAEGTIR
jgi:hypothetical protein